MLASAPRKENKGSIVKYPIRDSNADNASTKTNPKIAKRLTFSGFCSPIDFAITDDIPTDIPMKIAIIKKNTVEEKLRAANSFGPS